MKPVAINFWDFASMTFLLVVLLLDAGVRHYAGVGFEHWFSFGEFGLAALYLIEFATMRRAGSADESKETA